MSITREIKEEIIIDHQMHKTDNGSAAVQVGILTKRIEIISDHLKKFRKDLHSRYGLLKLVSRRKKLLAYIKNDELEKYRNLIKKLGIRK